MSDDIHSVHLLPETESTDGKCTIFSFISQAAKGHSTLRAHLALADSIHSVGIVSELTTLETLPPQEAQAAQPQFAEPQIDPDQIGQAVNVPYLPECKDYPSRYSVQPTIPSISHLRSIQQLTLPIGVLDHFPWYASLGSITFEWYDRYLRDLLRDSIQQFNESAIFIFSSLGRRPDTTI